MFKLIACIFYCISKNEFLVLSIQLEALWNLASLLFNMHYLLFISDHVESKTRATGTCVDAWGLKSLDFGPLTWNLLHQMHISSLPNFQLWNAKFTFNFLFLNRCWRSKTKLPKNRQDMSSVNLILLRHTWIQQFNDVLKLVLL